MKRYLVFVGDLYYPGGGMNDFEFDFYSLDDAITYAKSTIGQSKYVVKWAHIWDNELKQIVWEDE